MIKLKKDSNHSKIQGEQTKVNLIDYIAELGLDAGKDYLNERKNQKEVKKKIKEFVERQSKIHELASLAEEIDFDGLAEYMKGNLAEDIQKRLFGVNKEERRIAREQIFSKAIIYAGAESVEAKRKVTKVVSIIIEMLHKYYLGKVDKGTILIAAELEEALNQGFDKVSRKIDDAREKHSLVSIESSIKAISEGNLESVENNMNTFLDCISVEHTLSPYYKFAPKIAQNGKVQMFSKPVSTEALKKYPPKIRCKGKIKIGDKYLKEFNVSVIEYANRHQIPITMEIQQAKKYLGTIEDPIQHEAVDLLGQELVIPPKPFPDAVPCKLCIDDHVEFDYLLLRIQEIEDDETVVITNKEQANCPFIFSFRINIKNGTLKFTISKENLTNFELLQYTKFIAKIHEGAILKLKRLDENWEIECPLNELDYISEFSSIENEIDFLEKVVTIEKYYKNPLALPEDILFEDYKVISYMANLINGKEVERKWTEAAFSFDLCDSTKKSILNMEDEVFYFYFKAVVTVKLYGKTYQLPIIRTYHQARIRNLPRLLQKVKVLDNGDRLKIVVIPDSKECPSIYTDVLETEENKIR